MFHSAGAAHDGIISISKLKPLTDPWMLKAVVMLYQMVQKLRLEYLIGWCWTMTFQTHTFIWILIFRRIKAFWDMGCLFPYICSAPYVVEMLLQCLCNSSTAVLLRKEQFGQSHDTNWVPGPAKCGRGKPASCWLVWCVWCDSCSCFVLYRLTANRWLCYDMAFWCCIPLFLSLLQACLWSPSPANADTFA